MIPPTSPYPPMTCTTCKKNSHQTCKGVINSVLQSEVLHHLKESSVVKATGVSRDKLIHAVLLGPVRICPAMEEEEGRKGDRCGVGGLEERESVQNSKGAAFALLQHKQQLLSLFATIYGKPRKMFTLLYIVNLQQSQAESQVRLSWGW